MSEANAAGAAAEAAGGQYGAAFTNAQSTSIWAHGGLGRAGLHALAGCVGAVAGRGKCKGGALSAGFAEFAGPRLDARAPPLVSRMLVGGISAELGGGKFANGAMTAAFGYLFNFLAHKRHQFQTITEDSKVYSINFSNFDGSPLGASQIPRLGWIFSANDVKPYIGDLWLRTWSEEAFGTSDTMPDIDNFKRARAMENDLKLAANKYSNENNLDLNALTRSQLQGVLGAMSQVPGFVLIFGTVESIMNKYFPSNQGEKK